MAEHLSDEEQIEALKRWWKTNGTQLVLIVVLSLGGWFGWSSWQQHKLDRAADASVLYNAMIDAAGQWEAAPTLEQADVVRGHAETLKSFVSGSEYADFASLMLARLAVANEEYDAAAAELRAVMESTRDDSLALLARLRLARVEVTRGDATLALALLDQVDPASYKGLYAELKGDIQSLQGDKEAARAAYQLALDALDPTDSRSRAVIELKLNEVMPANVVTANDDEENV